METRKQKYKTGSHQINLRLLDDVSVRLVTVAVRLGWPTVTVTVSSAAAASSVTVAVIVEEEESDQVDPEARAAHDQHQLRVVDFFRLEKFLKKKKRTSLKLSRYTGGKNLRD